jgi:hypothetical protein
MANSMPISNYLGVPVYGSVYDPDANPGFADFSQYNQDLEGVSFARPAPVAKPSPIAGLLKPAVGLGASYATNSLLGGGTAAALPSIAPLAGSATTLGGAAGLTGSSLPSIAPLTGSAATLGGTAGLSTAGTFAMPGAILGSEILGAALPVAGIAAGTYGLYDTFKKPQNRQDSAMQAALSGAAIGAGAGSFIPVIGTGLGAAIGAGIGGLSGLAFGKDMPHPETTDRRTAIELLREAGIVDGNRDINLGSSGSLHLGDPQQRSAYNINLSQADPTSVLGQTVGGVGPLAALIAASQNGQSFNTPDLMKRASDMAGLLSNGAMATKNPLESAGALYKSFGLDRDTTYQGVAKLAEMGAIDPQTRDAWFAATDRMFNVRNPNAPAEDQARFDQFQRDQGRTPGQAVKVDGPSKLDLSSFFKTAGAAQVPSLPQAPSVPDSGQAPRMSSKFAGPGSNIGAALGAASMPPGLQAMYGAGQGAGQAIGDYMYRYPAGGSPDLGKVAEAFNAAPMGQPPRVSSKFAGPGGDIGAALGAASMPQTPVQAPAQAPTASYFPSAPTNREEFGNMIAALSMSRTGPEAMRYFGGGKK